MSDVLIPDNCKYTDEHEWVRAEGDVVVIGITAYAAEQLGDITYVELPPVDDEVEAGGEMGVIESVKAAADVYAPISGVVAEVNEGLEDDPAQVNTEPYGAGWLVKLKDFDAEALAGLMDPAAYKELLGGL